MLSVVQLLQSFSDSPLTIEQADRLAAIRQAAAGFAACLYQGLPDSPYRDAAIMRVRESLAMAREAVGAENAPPGVDPNQERRELLGRIDGLTKRQHAVLAALLGLMPEPTKANGKAKP